MVKVIGSIVTFNPNYAVLVKTIKTFLASSPNSKVFVWDNSSQDLISKKLLEDFSDQIHYSKSPENFGYGKGHNAVFNLAPEQFTYFCILNPDLEIPKTTIPSLISYMEQHPEVGLVTGLIQGVDGIIHQVHKLLPSFSDYLKGLIARFLKLPEPPVKTIKLDAQTEPFKLPILSGCFLFFRKEHYAELKGFDETFFLYFEDYDLSLRSFLANKSIILPNVRIIHLWSRESRRNWRLFFMHITSGLKFYLKWGFTKKLPKKIQQQLANEQ